MSDPPFSPTEVLTDPRQHSAPLRKGVLHTGQLPLAEDRTAACQNTRGAGAVARDVRGAYVISDVESASRVRQHPELFSSKRAFGALGSPGIDNVLLIFPPGGAEAGKDL